MLNISGFQDYGQAESVFDLLHTAYIKEPPTPIACVLTVGTKTRTFDANPLNDPPFGGDAGAAMTADLALGGRRRRGRDGDSRPLIAASSYEATTPDVDDDQGDEGAQSPPVTMADTKAEIAQAAVDAGFFDNTRRGRDLDQGRADRALGQRGVTCAPTDGTCRC